MSRLDEVLSQLPNESVHCVVTSPGPGDFDTVIWHQTYGGRRGTVLLLVKQRKYWFDLDAIRVPERTLRLVGGRGKNPGDVWPVDAMDHVAAFPVEVAKRCVAAGCPPAGTVLDPFSAGDSVRVAARSLGRRFLGRDDLMRREVQDAA